MCTAQKYRYICLSGVRKSDDAEETSPEHHGTTPEGGVQTVSADQDDGWEVLGEPLTDEQKQQYDREYPRPADIQLECGMPMKLECRYRGYCIKHNRWRSIISPMADQKKEAV